MNTDQVLHSIEVCRAAADVLACGDATIKRQIELSGELAVVAARLKREIATQLPETQVAA